MLFNVSKVDADGTALVKVTYQAVSYSLDSPTDHAKYDSQHLDEHLDPLVEGMSALDDQSFTMRLSSDGRVSDVQGVEQIMQRADTLLAAVKEPIKSRAQAAVRQNCGPKATQERMEDIFNIYSTAPVAIGERWSRTHVSTMGIPCYFTTYSKITSRKQGVANLKLYTDIRPNSNAPAMNYGDTGVKTLLSGTQEGNLSLDEATGLILRASTTMQLTGKLELTTAGKTQSYPVTVTGASSAERF
jgi:hypothetical protein